jgi:hypothetical protein
MSARNSLSTIRQMSIFNRHAPIVAGLLINLAATGYTIFNPVMGKELFTLYGITTGALYGYSQQLQTKESNDNRESEDTTGL